MLVKICGNWKDVLATRRDNVNVCYLNGCDLFEKVRYSKRCVFSIRFAMVSIWHFNLAKTVLKMGAVIVPDVLKQPLCSVLTLLGTKTAHVWKIQNDSGGPKCLVRGQNSSKNGQRDKTPCTWPKKGLCISVYFLNSKKNC